MRPCLRSASSALFCNTLKWAWPFLLHGRGTFLVLEISTKGLTGENTTITHWKDGIHVLPSSTDNEEEDVEFHYGSLAYVTRTDVQHKAENYGQGQNQKTTETFRRFTNKLVHREVEKDEISSETCLVPAQFCAMRHINNVRYLPLETMLEITILKQLKVRNAQRLQGTSFQLPETCRSSKTLVTNCYAALLWARSCWIITEINIVLSMKQNLLKEG